MDLKEFDYQLPEELIAQYPLARGRERLLAVDRNAGAIRHEGFTDFSGYLRPGDVLVLNDSKVIHARLHGHKVSGGKIEVFLVRDLGDDTWSCLVKASKSPKPGSTLIFDRGLEGEVLGREENMFLVRFSDPDLLDEVGALPLPPYIQRQPEDHDEAAYQTVYARHSGSVAAPTAGLHFTDESLADLAARGVELAYITLHVGPGTFQPVRVDRVEDHLMHSEEFEVSEQAAATIMRARAEGRRIITVGTTSTRVIEHLMVTHGAVIPGTGSTRLFIYPGYRFRGVDAMLTNLHLPCSTLLMLVCTFGGKELIMEAYHQAIERGYRFFSYGDAMLIF